MSPAHELLDMSTSEAFKFAKLKGANYSTWADHMQSTLQSKYLWLIVKGTETCLPAPPATRPTAQTVSEYKAERKDYLDWLLRDEAAQGVMKGACEDSQLPYVKDCESAKEMWDTLKKVHVTNQARINVHYYFEDLYTRKYIDGTTMADHIAAMLDIKRQINDAGESLDDIHVARAMVLLLPKTQSWDIIKIQLFDVEPDKLTIDTVSTKLQSEANRHMREKGTNNTALYVQKKDTRKREKGSGKGPYAVCRDGGHSGHKAEECPHDYKNRNKAKAKSQPQSTNYTVNNLRNLGTREIGQVFMTVGGIPDTNDILLDSAATSHMFCK
jgi:hypothetical protein